MRTVAAAAVAALGLLLASPPRPAAAAPPTRSFVVYDAHSGRTSADGPLADTPLRPCSTFKIPNTLIGLTTGVIPDRHFRLAWDGVTRERPEWNRDQDLASAIRDSVVWFYQEVARRIGPARMQQLVDAFGYGNRRICCAIDDFWLRGELRISPRQQVEFLRRVDAGALPLAPAHVALLHELITLDRGRDWRFEGKTGSCRDGGNLAWLVGYAVHGARTSVYAFLERGDGEPMSREARVAEVERLLRARGLLPPR